jgi:hypothetical protein
VGGSWEIISDLNLTADYYRISVEDIVSNLGSQSILDSCAASGAFCAQIQRSATPSSNGDGFNILGTPSAGGANDALISATALNLSEQEVHGTDVSLRYLLKAPWGIGRFTSMINWSHLTSVKVRSVPTGPFVQQLNNNDTLIMPRDRYNLEVDWELARFGATVRVDQVGEYPGGQSGLTVQPNEFVEEFTTVNLQARTDFGRLGMVRLGVDNVFDEDFSRDPTYTAGTPGVQNQYIESPTGFYSNPLGRVGYVQYEVRF